MRELEIAPGREINLRGLKNDCYNDSKEDVQIVVYHDSNASIRVGEKMEGVVEIDGLNNILMSLCKSTDPSTQTWTGGQLATLSSLGNCITIRGTLSRGQMMKAVDPDKYFAAFNIKQRALTGVAKKSFPSNPTLT